RAPRGRAAVPGRFDLSGDKRGSHATQKAEGGSDPVARAGGPDPAVQRSDYLRRQRSVSINRPPARNARALPAAPAVISGLGTGPPAWATRAAAASTSARPATCRAARKATEAGTASHFVSMVVLLVQGVSSPGQRAKHSGVGVPERLGPR